VLVELADCVAETVEDTELVARWNHVDVADLLQLHAITVSLRYDP